MAEQSAPVPFYDSTGKPLPRLPKVIRPGTCAAVFNERGEILLQKRSDNGFWSMPGGPLTLANRCSRERSGKCGRKQGCTCGWCVWWASILTHETI